MSKLNLTTKAAVIEVENLTLVVKGLREELAKLKTSSTTTFKQTAAASGRLADAVNELFNAKSKLIKARQAEKASIADELTAYDKLKAARTEQLKIMQDLIAKNKASSKEVKAAASSFKNLEAQIQKVNNTIKGKTASSYDILVNKTRLAKEALQNLMATNRAGNKTLDRAKTKYVNLANQVDSVRGNIKALTAVENQNASAVKSQSTAYDILFKRVSAAKKAMFSNRIEHGKNSRAARKATNEYKRLARQMRKVRGEASGLTKGFKKFLPSLTSIAGALGFAGIIYSMVQFVKQTIVTIKTLDSLALAVRFTGKTIFEISQSTIFITQLISKFGVELVSTTNRWIKFRAAAKQSGLTLKVTQDIFRSMTKAGSTLGLKTDELRGIYLALEQMLSKGKVTTEELRRQLGERLPGAMGILAASMNKTIPELDKMLKRGEVLSAEVLPRMADAVEVAFGVESVEVIETFQTALGRLQGAWQMFIDKVINDGGQASNFFSKLLDNITGIITHLTKIGASVPSLIDILVAEEQDKTRLANDAAAIVKAEENTGLKLLDLKKDLSKAEIAIQDAQRAEQLQIREAGSEEEAEIIRKSNDANFAILEETQRRAFKTVLDFEDDKNAARRENAAEFLTFAEKNIKDLEEYFFPKPDADGNAIVSKAAVDRASEAVVTVGKYTGKVEELALTYARLKGLINDSTLALEKGFGTRNRDVEDGDVKKLKTYKTYIDGQLELDLKRLNSLKERKEQEESLEETTFTRKRELSNQLLALSEVIAQKELELAVEKARIQRDNDLAKVKRDEVLYTNSAQEKKRINDKYLKTVEDAELAHTEKIVDINLTLQERMDNIKETSSTLQVKSLIRDNNIKIGELKRELDWEETTADRREEISDELRRLEIENSNLMTQAMILLLEAKLALAETELPDASPVLAKLRNAIAQLKADYKVFFDDSAEDKDLDFIGWQDYLDKVGEIFAKVGEIVDNVHQQRIENIEAEIRAEEYRFDRLIELAGDNEKAEAALQRQKEDRLRILEKKQLKERQKQVKAAKVFAIFEIGINTAIGISNALAQPTPVPFNIAMAALIGALGLAQTIAVATKPLPKYARGGVSPRDEFGQINDAGKQEYIERNGQILTTKQANAVVPLKRHDIVHKDYASLRRRSLLLNGFNGGQEMSEPDFNMFFKGIENSIGTGLKKVKITPILRQVKPTVIVINEQSRWN